MNTQELLNVLFPTAGQKHLTADQEKIVRHPNGPAWVMAGPGSGKTEVLTVLLMRLLYVENDPIQQTKIPPESIVVTTFTEKAARNLEDRISQYRSHIVAAHPELSGIDISKLRIGTLHGLCNDLMQEFRDPNYQNVRLMDEFEQALFVREHMSLIKQANPPFEMDFWKKFPWLFRQNEWQATWSYPPNRWNSTNALVNLLNRLVEDRVSVTDLKNAGGQLKILADLFEEYVAHLQHNYRCDFSQLQARFLDFLRSPLGKTFRDGDDSTIKPGIQWVLVDEYQDTNPIQEEIYFELAKRAPHNLVVVGDDDQAMYRFRGGSVECMVTFNDACQAYLGIPKTSVALYPLVDNFRSHKDIVTFFNEFISSFPVMAQQGARAPKPAIKATKAIPQAYPAVGCLSATKLDELATKFAQTVRGLVDNGTVNDPSECCLLLKSTKETPHNAKKYVDALKKEGLAVYNPRNKAFAQQEEVQGLLGALLAVLDPHRRYAMDPNNKVPEGEAVLRSAFDNLAATNPDLAAYVKKASASLAAKPGKPLDANLQELAYYLLSLDPFDAWQQDPIRRIRIGKITKLLEAYSSMPVLDPSTGLARPGVSRGFIRSSDQYPGEGSSPWLGGFYQLFLGYILNAGFDDEEDEDVIAPAGLVPIMTIHQSKGLEFPFVFVGHLNENPSISASHELETLFSNYPANPARAFPRAPANERSEMDMIRQYYVAYSRAKYALVLLGTKTHFSKQSVPLGPTAKWVQHRTNAL